MLIARVVHTAEGTPLWGTTNTSLSLPSPFVLSPPPLSLLRYSLQGIWRGTTPSNGDRPAPGREKSKNAAHRHSHPT